MQQHGVPLALEEEWRKFLKPWWGWVSHVATIASLDLFAVHMADKGMRPREVAAWSIGELVSKLLMFESDAGALTMAFALSAAERARPSADFTLADIAPPIGQLEAVKIRDLHFAERALVSYDIRGRVDFAETLLCSAGPEETVGVDEKIHAILTIPEAIIISTSLGSVYDFARTRHAATAAGEDHSVAGQVTAHTFLELISFFLNSFAFVYSMAQIALCSFAKLTDRSAAHYLTIPIGIRFLDLILVAFGMVVLQPASLIVISYDVDAGSSSVALFSVAFALGVIYFLVNSLFFVYFFMRERTAYDQFPPHLKVDEPLYAQNLNAASDQSGFLARASSLFERYFMRSNDEKELAYMGHIGRWRKFLLAKRYRESIFDAAVTSPGPPEGTPERDPPPAMPRSPELNNNHICLQPPPAVDGLPAGFYCPAFGPLVHEQTFID